MGFDAARNLKGPAPAVRSAFFFALGSLLACSDPGPARSVSPFAPTPFGSATVPYSENGTVALLPGSELACVIDSYEFRIHCVDSVGWISGVFGDEGEGPGELGSNLAGLIGGRDGTVGVIDNALKRFTVFTPSGLLVTTAPLPSASIGLNATGIFGDTLTAVALTAADPMKLAAGAGPGGLYAVFDIEVSTGRILRQQELPPVSAAVDCGTVHSGFPNRLGGWLYIACEGHLVLLAENGETTVIQAPTCWVGLR